MDVSTTEKKREYRKRWIEKDVENYRKIRRGYVLKAKERKAGRPRPEFCEICAGTGKIVFEHCHDTGKFRGWVCVFCNVALGVAKENSTRLRLLADYIDNWNKRLKDTDTYESS